MQDFFELKKHNTTVKQEITAGLTTFFTMAYIIFVNPAILSKAGMDFYSVMLATCISAGVGTLIMGLYARYPFAQAPGMGLNAFFTFTVVLHLGYTWQQALAIVFISGVIFIILTITGLRKVVVESIPAVIRNSIPAGIGLFIAFIGLNNAGIVKVNQGPILDILYQVESFNAGEVANAVNSAPPQVLQFGDFGNPAVLLAIIGFFIMALLLLKEVKGALFWGILITVILGFPLGVTKLPESFLSEKISLTPTLFQLDFIGLFSGTESSLKTIFTVITVIISFTLVDLFDTLGTLIATASKGGFLDKDGKLPRINQALIADAISTTTGALLGTSSVTTYIESGSGVVAGGRTGLTAVTVSILFFLSVFLAPFAGMIPAAATSPALVIVGVLMMASLKNIDFGNLEEAVPAFLIIALMPFSYSIANGIAAGLIAFTFIQVIKGNFSKVEPTVLIISVLFLLHFALL